MVCIWLFMNGVGDVFCEFFGDLFGDFVVFASAARFGALFNRSNCAWLCVVFFL